MLENRPAVFSFFKIFVFSKRKVRVDPVMCIPVKMPYDRKEESVVAWPIDLSGMETYRKVGVHPDIMLA